jgi:uncharacterized protein (TIGR02246 family)
MGLVASPDDLAETFFAAINTGDLEAAVQLWLDDAQFVGPGAAPIEGMDAIRGVLATLIDNRTQMAVADVTTFVAGPVAMRTGWLKLTGTPPHGEPFESVSEFVTIYALGDDGWRIAIDAPAGLP